VFSPDLAVSFFFSLLRRHPPPTLFPYTTLFRSHAAVRRRLGPGDHLDADTVVLDHEGVARPRACLDVAHEGRIDDRRRPDDEPRSEEHTSELQSRGHLVCRLLLEKKKIIKIKKE